MTPTTRFVGILTAFLLVLCTAAHGHVIGGGSGSGGGGSAGGMSIVSATADITDNTSAGTTNATGLAVPLAASSNYSGICYVMVSSAITTTGVHVGFSGPAGITSFRSHHRSFASVGTEVFDYFTEADLPYVNAEANSPGATRSIYTLYWVLQNGGTAGNLQVIFNTEVDTSTVTIHDGSWCEWTQIP